jgi:glycoside/pentoside/hexuronide:cation symporter, GPH family
MTTLTVSKANLSRYAFIAMPLAFAGLPLYIHVPDFYTRDLGMNIGILGAVLLAIRLFDAVQDPVIGYLTDRYAKRRYLIINLGFAMLLAGMAGVLFGAYAFLPLSLWFGFFMLLATTGFSIVTINLNMIGGFWRDSENERTRISAWREGFTLLGLLCAALLPTALQGVLSPALSFVVLFGVFALLAAGGIFLFHGFISKLKQDENHTLSKEAGHSSGFTFFKLLFGRDRTFFFVCFLAHVAASLPAVLVLFFIRDYLGGDAYTGLFLLIYFLSGAALINLWVKLSEKTGQYKAWLVSMILSVVTFIGAYFLQEGDIIAFAFICALSGMALGADLALPPAIVAERIQNGQSRSDATQYYALLAFLPKAAIAIAGGCAFIALDIFGFKAGEENSADELHTLIILYALVPCLIKLLAALALWFEIKKEKGKYNENLERSSIHGTISIS